MRRCCKPFTFGNWVPRIDIGLECAQCLQVHAKLLVASLLKTDTVRDYFGTFKLCQRASRNWSRVQRIQIDAAEVLCTFARTTMWPPDRTILIDNKPFGDLAESFARSNDYPRKAGSAIKFDAICLMHIGLTLR